MTNQDNKSIDNMDLFRNQYTEKVLMDSIDKLSTYDIVYRKNLFVSIY